MFKLINDLNFVVNRSYPKNNYVQPIPPEPEPIPKPPEVMLLYIF